MAVFSRLGHVALRGTMIVLTGQMIMFFVNFLTQRFLNVSMSLADNGTFFLIQRISELALTITVEAGMTNIVWRMLLSEPETEHNEILAAFWQLRFALWTVTVCCLAGILYMLYDIVPLATVFWCASYGFGARTVLLRAIPEARWRIHSRFLFPTILSVVESMMILACLYADSIMAGQTVGSTFLSLERITGWYMLIAVTGFGVTVFFAREWHLFTHALVWRRMKDILRIASPMIVSVLLMQIADKIDTVLLEYLCGRTSVGAFGIVVRATSPLQVVVMSVLIGIFPPLVHIHVHKRIQAQVLLYKLFRFCMIGGIGISMIMAVVSPSVAIMLAGGYGTSLVSTFWIAFWSLPCSFIVQFILSANTAFGQQRLNTHITMWWVVLAVIGGTIGILIGDVVGVFVARGITYTILACVGMITLHRHFLREIQTDSTGNTMFAELQQRVPRFIILRLFLLAGISLVLSWYVMTFHPVWLALLCVTGWFSIGVIALRLITVDDIHTIQMLLRKKSDTVDHTPL